MNKKIPNQLFIVYRIHRKFNMQYIEHISFNQEECLKIKDKIGDSYGYSTGITKITGKPMYLKILQEDFIRKKRN